MTHPITWARLKRAAEGPQGRRHRRHRLPFSKLILADFLKAEGWDVELEQDWVSHNYSLRATKAGQLFSLPSHALLHPRLAELLDCYEQACRTEGVVPEYRTCG